LVDTIDGKTKLKRVAVGTKPGVIATYGRISYIVRRGFLWCRLPSGRCLAYGSPRIEDRKTPWGDVKPSVTALGVDSVTKRWTRFALYGGLLTENCVQAVARDLMAYGMLQVEDAGFPVVMTVHDEAVADVPEGHGTLAEFERLLCALPDWAAGLPVVASGWEKHRYCKD
jgi:DNA polymerase bacteriophage-type